MKLQKIINSWCVLKHKRSKIAAPDRYKNSEEYFLAEAPSRREEKAQSVIGASTGDVNGNSDSVQNYEIKCLYKFTK